MGARAEQQLALNFLTVIHGLWLRHPGRYLVRESSDDLVPALAQMCIAALAAQIRDGRLGERGTTVKGELRNGLTVQPIDVRDAVNKIIHGAPVSIDVRAAEVWLTFQNSTHDQNARWTEMEVSGTDLLRYFEDSLYKHRDSKAEAREHAISQLIQELGPQRFLPTVAG